MVKMNGCDGGAWSTYDYLPIIAVLANCSNLTLLDMLKTDYASELQAYWSESGYDTDGIWRKLKIDLNPRTVENIRKKAHKIGHVDPVKEYDRRNHHDEISKIALKTVENWEKEIQVVFIDATISPGRLGEMIEQVRQKRRETNRNGELLAASITSSKEIISGGTVHAHSCQEMHPPNPKFMEHWITGSEQRVPFEELFSVNVLNAD